ncbi:MAG: flavin reductase [Acutalibacteraceae bacterium]
MAKNPMFNISYGLYVLTAKEGDKDNGCIINTFAQVTSNPDIVSITVNKANYTNGMIDRTKKFNVSVLTTETPFGVFEHFGFQSGKDTEKFFKNENEKRSDNGILYLPSCTNAYFSCEVIEQHDYGTHTMFIAKVVQMEVLSDEKSLTYDYYHANIKPKPQSTKKVKGFRCRICGYVYEGDELPEDFVCPLCKHGAEDFERIE